MKVILVLGMFLGWAYEGETGTRYVPRLGI